MNRFSQGGTGGWNTASEHTGLMTTHPVFIPVQLRALHPVSSFSQELLRTYYVLDVLTEWGRIYVLIIELTI